MKPVHEEVLEGAKLWYEFLAADHDEQDEKHDTWGTWKICHIKKVCDLAREMGQHLYLQMDARF